MSTYAPGFPLPNPNLSFWLQGTRSSNLIGHRTTPELPEHADVVIIGAGISGATTAYFLLTGPNPPKKVVMLEAREVCDGATGRNGGNCRPVPYSNYIEMKEAFGKEQALKIIKNEKDTLELLLEVVKKEGIDCDLWMGQSYEIALDQGVVDDLADEYNELKADGGDMSPINWISDPADAQKRTRIHAALLAVETPSASLWPYKLVAHLVTLCIEKYGLNVQTHTPVRTVSPQPSGKWGIQTDRGQIVADKVVYASNAFTATLLPEFSGRIYPFLGQVSAIVPTKAYSGPNMLSHVFLVIYDRGAGRTNYAMQRPKDGVLIVGGGAWNVEWNSLKGNTDDVNIIQALKDNQAKCLKDVLEGWGDEGVGEGLMTSWTGVMAYTPDMVPYVGPLHGKPGAFITAGHSGHGMARTFTCSRGIASLIRGESWDSTGLPECFEPTPERLKKSI